MLLANDFPMGTSAGASLYYEDSFLVMGGEGVDACTGCDCSRYIRDLIFRRVTIANLFHCTFKI